jgi:hypothetical protein
MPVNPEPLRGESFTTSEPPSLGTPPISPQAITVAGSSLESSTCTLVCPAMIASLAMGMLVYERSASMAVP